MNPVNEGEHVVVSNNQNTKNKNSGSLFTIISVAGFILLALGVIIFLYNQNQSLKKKIAALQASPTPSSVNLNSPTPSINEPSVTTPLANSKVKSPLKITGTVPSGWMFEGVFPIKLLDSNQNVIARGQAKEVVSGSWQSGKPIEFSATLTFKSASGAGTLVLEKDNPSGNPENIKKFEVPIIF